MPTLNDTTMSLEEEIARLNTLRNAAGAIVDFVRFGSKRHSKSEFELTESEEWVLRPDNWIRLTIHYKQAGTIDISLGLEEREFEKQEALRLRPGMRPGWTRILIEFPIEIPAALNYIEQAYWRSKNEYRNLNGPPKPLEAIKTTRQRLEEFYT